MIFLITKAVQRDGSSVVAWSLHRTEKGGPGDLICIGPDTWPSERQARANINTFKRATSGTSTRFSKVQVKSVPPPAPKPVQPWHGGDDQRDCEHCRGDESLCDGEEC